MSDFHVIVKFGKGITADVQGIALLWLEKYLREEHEIPAEVYKETAADDSKLRLRLVDAGERGKL